MGNASIDDNRVRTALGWDETNLVTIPLQCATASGRLLVDVIDVIDSTKGSLKSKIDDNYVRTCLVQDSNGNIVPLMIDTRNGCVYVDIISA